MRRAAKTKSPRSERPPTCLIRCLQIRRNNQQIVACFERINRRTPDVRPVEPREARHIQRVGHHNSFESEMFLQ